MSGTGQRPTLLLAILLFAANLHAQDQSNSGAAPAATAPQSSAASAPHPMRIRIGGNVQMANLTHRVDPVYPAIAKTAQVSGTVVLHIIVAADGTVKQADYVSGPILLQRAAIDAVQEWRYRPTLLNGEPVEVDTQIAFAFSLTDKGPEVEAIAPPPGAAPAKQDSPSASSDSRAIDPQFRVDILHLLDVTKVKERTSKIGETLFESLRPAILASLPATPNREKIADTYMKGLIGLFSTPEFTDGMVDIYARFFTDDDVKSIAEFFQTPAGQHFNDVSAQLFSAGSDEGQALARKHLPGILRSLCDEYPELKGEAKFCPGDSEKKGD